MIVVAVIHFFRNSSPCFRKPVSCFSSFWGKRLEFYSPVF